MLTCSAFLGEYQLGLAHSALEDELRSLKVKLVLTPATSTTMVDTSPVDVEMADDDGDRDTDGEAEAAGMDLATLVAGAMTRKVREERERTLVVRFPDDAADSY